MKIVPIKQRDGSACGPTCIKMAAQYFNVPITLDKIGKMSRYKQKGGLTNQNLIDSLKNIGLTPRTKSSATWGDLRKSSKPDCVTIVSWMKKGYVGHFSIVRSVKDDYIIIIDPEDGKLHKITKAIFLRLWMDYDDMWYPLKNTDVQLRWMCVVSKTQKSPPKK
jgi:ATP-binding cassette subfamily B protein